MIRPAITDDPPPGSERMWPLDIGLAVLGALVGYTVVSQLRFDDPRPLYNSWTYVFLVPTGVIALSLLSRLVASRFLEKSAQLGFLASVLVHLGLLMMAVNVIVFGRYFPEAFTGAPIDREVKQKTVPDYLFSSPSEQPTTPDWSKPVDAETASKVVPIEQRLIMPVENTAARLEMPSKEVVPQRDPEKFLTQRQTPESSLPMPADSPGERSKNLVRISEALPGASRPSITVPDVPAEASPSPAPAERQARLDESFRSTERLPVPAPTPSVTPSPVADLASVMREQGHSASMAARATPAVRDELPRIGQSGASPQRPSPSQLERVLDAAGAAPAPLTVAIARQEAASERLMSPIETPMVRTRTAMGASLGANDQPMSADALRPGSAMSSAPAALPALSEGVPSVSAGAAIEAMSRQTAGRRGVPGIGDAGSGGGVAGFEPASPSGDLAAMAAAMSASSGGSAAAATQAIPTVADGGNLESRLARSEPLSRGSGRSSAPLGDGAGDQSMRLEVDLPAGAGGVGETPAVRAGVSVSLDAQPEIGAVSLRPSQRKRLDIGGPVQPAGSEVASVESFKRRVLRTRGSGTPTPAGLVGPETEEAIERGLKYITSCQAPDGHWSLQGQGERVLLRSDTAATGLCLLSFQGAGYTHTQHQYAAVVSSGLRALIAMQQPDGNLYRREDPVSDQNVAFYSHGIAALALCEAYGMTRDESLRDPAQRAIDYIVNTQHRERGGWRYQPQVSSDTSVSGWMMMALKSGELAGLTVPRSTYDGIERWLETAKLSPDRGDRYRYNPFAPDTPAQRHGRDVTPSMTAVAMLMRMYGGWRRDTPDMQGAADYLAQYPPAIGDAKTPFRDTYYWYYATQVMFHMGGQHWEDWNQKLKPILIDGQIKSGSMEGSWDPVSPVPDRWSVHAGRLYLTTLNLLSLEVYYRHLPIYEDTAK